MLLTKEMSEEVNIIFKTITGNENTFSYVKLPLALKALGLSMKDLDDALIKQSMASDSINLEQFTLIVEDCRTKSNYMVNEINQTFELFDRDKDEWLSAKDVMETLEKVHGDITIYHHVMCTSILL